jgi:hypothetical protein
MGEKIIKFSDVKISSLKLVEKKMEPVKNSAGETLCGFRISFEDELGNITGGWLSESDYARLKPYFLNSHEA